MGKSKIQERIEECKKYKDYENIKHIEKGVLYFNGNKLDIDKFLLVKTEILEDNSDQIEFDIEFKKIKLIDIELQEKNIKEIF